jgi:hypothetical protein
MQIRHLESGHATDLTKLVSPNITESVAYEGKVAPSMSF